MVTLNITKFMVITYDIAYINGIDDINLHGHVTLDKQAGKAVGQGLNTIGSQIGLGASIVGVSTAVGKAVGKSSFTPVQKAGVIVGSGLVAGLGHSMLTTLNRNQVLSSTYNNTSTTDNTASVTSDSINKLIDVVQTSPLQDLLFQFEALNYVCLSLIYILVIQVTFKFHFKDNINLIFSRVLGINLNNKLEYYINKIISLNKKMSVVYI